MKSSQAVWWLERVGLRVLRSMPAPAATSDLLLGRSSQRHVLRGGQRTGLLGGLEGAALLFSLLLTGLLGGCTGPKTCQSSTECPGDQTCVSGACIQRTCRSSQDCTIGSHCDPLDGLCKSGCVEEADCPYGQTCVEGACEARPCRSTTLDCAVGEYCDPLTGTCFKAAGPYCKPCTTASECGTDARCTYVSGEGPWCAPACDADRPCPAGYTCTPFTNSGSVISYNCVTLCQNLPAE